MPVSIMMQRSSTNSAGNAVNTKALEARERKRNQNRMAQQTYRRNHKERVRSLELVAGLRLADTKPHAPMTPATSENDQIWLSPLEEDLYPDPPMFDLDVPNVSQSGALEEDKSSPTTIQGGALGSFGSLTNAKQSILLNRTSLHRAVCARHESVTRLLLAQGADAQKQDGNGQTALHLAVESGHEGVVKILLESKVDPSVQDSMGQTALFQAIRCDNGSMAKLLLEASIDVNCRNAFGDVALHVAVEKGSELMIEMLLTHGADIDA